MGTLLVAVILAHGRQVRQIRQAERQLAGVRAADRLLADWAASPHTVFRNRQGAVPGGDGMAWQAVRRRLPGAEQLEMDVLTVSIHDSLAPSGVKALVSVDLLVPAGR